MSWCQWQDPQENKSPDGGSPQDLQTPQEITLGDCILLVNRHIYIYDSDDLELL